MSERAHTKGRERPILFSAPMVRALLDGRKTQTRRLIPHAMQDAYDEYDDWCRNVSAGVPTSRQWEPEYFLERTRIKAGNRLWVREAWRAEARYDHLAPSKLPLSAPIYYAADLNPRDSEPGCAGRLRASMHMPRWASRLTLPVTDVRVQRLQDISEEDAAAEGMDDATAQLVLSADERHMLAYAHIATPHALSRIIFETVWEQINGPESWPANPWVAAYTFTVERRNIDEGLGQRADATPKNPLPGEIAP